MVRIPSEYQEVEYIESTGKQWIDTGILVNSTVASEYKVVLASQFTQLSYPSNIICCCQNNGAAGTWFGMYDNVLSIGRGNNFSEDPLTLSEKIIVFSSDRITVTVREQTKYRMRGASSNESIRFFASRSNAYNSKAKIYSAKIYEDDSPIANLIPCYRKSDNEIGMYDTVTKTFFTNQGTGTFLKGNDVNYDTVNLMESRRRILLNTPHLESLSGSTLSLKTDMASKLKECKVYFTPKQNLNSYDRPWPAGSSKNLFDVSKITTGKTINASGAIVSASNGAYSELIPVEVGETYTFSAYSVDAGKYARRVHFYDSEGAWVEQGGIYNASINKKVYSITVTIPEGISYVRIAYRVYTNKATDEQPQFELGSSATSYVPYSNICPIEGYTGLTLYGENLYEYNPDNNGYISSTGKITADTKSTYSDLIPVEAEAEYIYRCMTEAYANDRPSRRIHGYDASGEWQEEITFCKSDRYYMPSEPAELKFTIPQGIAYIRISIRKLDTDTTVRKSLGISLDWTDTLGTIYGGYVDLVKGEVVEEWKCYDMGDLDWGADTTEHLFAYTFEVMPVNENNALMTTYCEGYYPTHNSSLGTIRRIIGNYAFMGRSSYKSLYFRDDSYTTGAEFKQGNAGNHIIVPLATPTTYPLDPVTIRTLRGQNNIWPDANGNIELKFWTH